MRVIQTSVSKSPSNWRAVESAARGSQRNQSIIKIELTGRLVHLLHDLFI
jgi:hypothetical protein